MKRHNEIAERIIKNEGLTFALAAFTCKEMDTARAYLKNAIMSALAGEFAAGAELQRRAAESNLEINELEQLISEDR